MGIPRKARFMKCHHFSLICMLFFLFQFILEGAESVNSVYLVKLSWPKTLVKKWFNIKSKAEDFHADDVVDGGLTLIMAYHFLSISA